MIVWLRLSIFINNFWEAGGSGRHNIDTKGCKSTVRATTDILQLLLLSRDSRPFLLNWDKFLQEKPKAILLISSHSDTYFPTVNIVSRDSTIYDLYRNDFPQEMYKVIDFRFYVIGQMFSLDLGFSLHLNLHFSKYRILQS